MSASKRSGRDLVTAALFAAVIALTTAYLFHIPVPTGYIHLGDAFLYLAASLLPLPYAVAAASLGAGLADLLTYPAWALPTLLIKAAVALLFTSRGETFLCRRNVLALFGAAVLSPTAYGVACVAMTGTALSFSSLSAATNGSLSYFPVIASYTSEGNLYGLAVEAITAGLSSPVSVRYFS